MLTEQEIQYGFDHGTNSGKGVDTVVELAELRGQTRLVINCTQLGDSFTPHLASPREKKRVLAEWCDHLRSHPTAFTELWFGTRVPQELFEAVCHQKHLTRLHLKWGAYEDLSAIERLGDLRYLQIGSGARVKAIAPLTKLQKLMALAIENFQKVSDYKSLAKIGTLESLAIEGDGLGPQTLKIASLDFLRAMPRLRHFRLLTARLQSKDFRPLLDLRQLEHLSLPSSPEVKNLYDLLLGLPLLRWGLLKERPDLFR